MIHTKRIEKLIVHYVNRSRRKRHLSVLKSSRGLRYLARRHSKRMAKVGKIWHGQNTHLANKYITEGFLERIFGFFFVSSSGSSGENCAMMFKGNVRGIGKVRTDKDIARALHKLWMHSPGHRSNILNSSFSRIGTGIVRSGNKFYATQVFYG